MPDIIYLVRDFLWSGPFLFLLISVGLFLTWEIKGIQTLCIKNLLGLRKDHLFKESNDDAESHTVRGDISSLQSLMTALAGAIGTGNITGIATAVVSGGFGALFWMWVVAFLGMATAYSETLLAVKYRVTNKHHEIIGGPMVTLKEGLNAKRFACAFAIFGSIAGLGYAMVQSNSVVDAVVSQVELDRGILGIVLALLSGFVVIGGVKRIGRAASALVPFMAVIYLSMSVVILGGHYDKILPAFSLILQSAFAPQAALGGLLGVTITHAIQNGAQFGIFANEAGLGSFAIAGACARTQQPVKQGFLAMSGVFISTMMICTITGLVLAVTEVVGTTHAGGGLISGSPLALLAFGSFMPQFSLGVIICLCFFAFTTILAWSYYGEKCLEFLFGLRIVAFYRWLYIICIALGAVMSLEFVWAFAHLANGCMAIPNLYSMIRLRKVVREETENYLNQSASLSRKPVSI